MTNHIEEVQNDTNNTFDIHITEALRYFMNDAIYPFIVIIILYHRLCVGDFSRAISDSRDSLSGTRMKLFFVSTGPAE